MSDLKERFTNFMDETHEYFGIGGKENKPEKPLLKYPKEKKSKAKKPFLKKFDKERKTKLQYANDPPAAMRKDTTTGFGVNIIDETPERKSMGGEIEVGKGKDYIKDLI